MRPGAVYPRVVRGNRANLRRHRTNRRSIPACAGEPRPDGEPARGTAVYPRVCGGTPIELILSAPFPGLSPRVRGNPVLAAIRWPPARSIPACAGNLCGQRSTPCSKVYPRVCGGTSDSPCHPAITERSIPACAGEPSSPGSWSLARRVYPRVCGGTGAHRWHLQTSLGLSPRVRGNPDPFRDGDYPVGSIPACAGEPAAAAPPAAARRVYPRVCGGTKPRCSHRNSSPWVYPRVCGGTRLCLSEAALDQGLSPRVRGNRVAPVPGHLRHRSIPRVRGTGATSVSIGRGVGLSPRVRGNHKAVARDDLTAGSIPRVRGNQFEQVRTGRKIWSIPACAGEPRS